MLDRQTRIFVGINALDDEFSAPEFSELIDEFPIHSGIRSAHPCHVDTFEHGPFADRPRRLARTVVARTALSKIFRARAQVRFAVAPSGIVYRQQHHCRTGRLNTPQQLFAGFPLAWRVELVPNRTAQCFIHLFDWRRGHRRKALQGPAGASCACHGHLSVHVEPALTACGTQENRAVINRAEQLHTRINKGGIVQTTWP